MEWVTLLWHNEIAGLNARLLVVPMEGWRRSMMWTETGLMFRPPSPNIPTPRTALLYAGVGAFESTNVSVGRGTPHPFEVFGAPWMDNIAIARDLSRQRLPGVRTRTVRGRRATRYSLVSGGTVGVTLLNKPSGPSGGARLSCRRPARDQGANIQP